MSDRSDFNDLAHEAGGAAVSEIVAAAAGKAAVKRAANGAGVDAADKPAADVVSIGDAWPDPILPGQRPVPEIPASLLPSWLGDIAGAVAESTQTPPAMAVMISLSVLATCLHRRFEVAPWGEDSDYHEPLALWTLTALPSGSRKSAVIGDLAKPLVDWEKLERDRLRPEIARVKSTRLVAKKRIEKLTKDATNADNDEERERIRKLIQSEEETMPAEIIAPRLFTGDITSERLQQLLAEHAERMAVLSDEAGIFNIMAGLYSGGMASIDVFLQGHAGASMRVDRPGRPHGAPRPPGAVVWPGLAA